uniref:(California timema) hypothetical protein n=1 Tax=Timema californicum TaxID=61474 RepID=A0A7R9IWM7_TIMCA|nr:unnamed protein product [Timema californicum]
MYWSPKYIYVISLKAIELATLNSPVPVTVSDDTDTNNTPQHFQTPGLDSPFTCILYRSHSHQGPCQLNKTVPCAIERKVFGKMSSEKYTKTDDRRDSWGVELDSLDKRTRFQVNRVDAATSKDCEEGSPLRDGEDDEGRGSRRESVDDTSGYDTRYAKSFRHFTREALPRADNYRNIMSIQAAYRPTLDELHNETIQAKTNKNKEHKQKLSEINNKKEHKQKLSETNKNKEHKQKLSEMNNKKEHKQKLSEINNKKEHKQKLS